MRQSAHDEERPKTRQHMRTHQRRQYGHQAVRAQQRQQAELGQQYQHQCHRAKRADARVLHDVQGPLPVGAAAQAIGHVGQAVLVEATSHPHRGDGAEHRRHSRCERVRGQRHVKCGISAPRAQRCQPAYARKMRRTRAQHGGAVTHPLRQPPGDGNAREELHGQQIVAQGLHRHRAIWSAGTVRRPGSAFLPHTGNPMWPGRRRTRRRPRAAPECRPGCGHSRRPGCGNETG